MAPSMLPLAAPVWAHAGRQRSRNSDNLDIWFERTRASLQWHDRRISPGFHDTSTPSVGINRSERMGSSPLIGIGIAPASIVRRSSVLTFSTVTHCHLFRDTQSRDPTHVSFQLTSATSLLKPFCYRSLTITTNGRCYPPTNPEGTLRFVCDLAT
jgi:hypothetical protein